ncbi:MAG: glycosyltransferase [Desulfobacteraceae bacterium]|nr:glycosyltransferase [Desulfobacteraceae bacterium]
MSFSPVVTVVIPVLNGADTLGDLLASLKHQAGLPGVMEILVVDNGSTDDTVKLAESQGVTVLRQPIRGPSAARNLGLSHASSEVVVFTDSDTIPTRRWLSSLCSVFAEPAVVLATGPIHAWQPKTAAERFADARGAYSPELTHAHPLHPFAVGMNVAVRREAARAVCGWDETMSSGEDVDFSTRLCKQFEVPIRFVPQAILFHHHRTTDEALWHQAYWHGAGYAQFQHRHPQLAPWTPLDAFSVFFSLTTLSLASPLVALGRRFCPWIHPQRWEFEDYYRGWTKHFWRGFFDQRRKDHNS